MALAIMKEKGSYNYTSLPIFRFIVNDELYLFDLMLGWKGKGGDLLHGLKSCI